MPKISASKILKSAPLKASKALGGSVNDLAIANLPTIGGDDQDSGMDQSGQLSGPAEAPQLDPNSGQIDVSAPLDRQFSQGELDQMGSEIDMQQKYGDHAGAAFVHGVAKGVIPGFDVIATHLGADPEQLRELQKRNQTASTIGEGVGLVGGALASGGENVVGTLAKGSVGGIIGGMEEAASKAISEGIFKTAAEKGIARRIVEKSISNAAGGALSGATLGINALANENALGDADLTGENLVAYAGTGAILNGLVGGAFGAAEALSPIAKSAVDSVSGQLKQTFKKELDFDRNLADLAAPSSSTALKRDIYSDLKSIDQGVKEDYIKNDWGLKYTDTPETMLEKHVAAGNKLKEDLVSAYKNVDSAAPNGIVPIDDLHNSLLDSLEDYKARNANQFDNRGAQNVLNQVRNEVKTRMRRVTGGDLQDIKTSIPQAESAQDVWKLAQTYGEKGYQEADTLKAQLYRTLNKKTRDMLQDNITQRTAGTSLEGLTDQIKNINQKYRTFFAIGKGIENKAASASALSGLKDSAIPIIGAMFAGPTGALAAATGSKMWSSDLRRRFIVLNTAERANIVGKSKIAETFKNYFDKAANVARVTAQTPMRTAILNSGWAVGDNRKKPDNEVQAFKNVAHNLTNMSVNPDNLAMKIATNTMNAGYAAPNATKFAQLSLGRATSFLYSKLPKDMVAVQDPFSKTDFKPSSLELSKFKRYLQTVENPYSTLKDLETGTLTKEHVEALQAVYPSIYNQMQQEAMSYAGKNSGLSYSKKVQLGMLLNIPTTPSLQPAALARLQMNFSSQGSGPSQPGGGGAVKSTQGGLGKISKSTRLSTDVEDQASGANRE